MAHRRGIHLLCRRAAALISLKPAPPLSVVKIRSANPQHTELIPDLDPFRSSTLCAQPRCFSSNKDDGSEDDDEDEEDYEIEESSEGEDDVTPESTREYSLEEKEAEAAGIGYKVVGPLQRSDRVFKPYEPIFAVVQLVLNKVLLLGSATQTIISRPIMPDAAVHAVVEEHALDAKVIIFKKKKRKNYRRTNGHRQELTKLRITDIQGIEKPEPKTEIKPLKLSTQKPEKLRAAA